MNPKKKVTVNLGRGTVTFFFRENCGFGRLSTITVRYKRFSCSEKEFLGVRADSKKRGGRFQNRANMAGRINRTVNGSPETTAKRCTKRLLRQHRTIPNGHPNAVQRARQEVHISREQIRDLRFTVPGNGGSEKGTDRGARYPEKFAVYVSKSLKDPLGLG